MGVADESRWRVGQKPVGGGHSVVGEMHFERKKREREEKKVRVGREGEKGEEGESWENWGRAGNG